MGSRIIKTAWDIIVAPRAALDALRESPTWGWALFITIVVGTLTNYLIVPAMQHGEAGTFAHLFATDPALAGEPPEKQQFGLAFAQKALAFGWLFVPVIVPFAALIAAVVMLLFDKIGRGEGSLATYWAVACNVAVPAYAVGGIVTAIIVLARGADTFSTLQEVQQAVPSLALLAPGANVKVSAFLGALTPFQLWGAGLNVAAMRIVGRVAALPAWLAALLMLIIPAYLAAYGAR
jgi:hypothetical protein